MAHDVFISYSSRDKLIADALCAALEQGGIRCWIAPRDVLAGRNWASAIIDAFNHARAVVLVFSAQVNTSEQVEREVHQAFSKELTVIPVRIERVEPEGAFEYWLRAPHWLDAFPPPPEQHFGKLIETVRRVLSVTAPASVKLHRTERPLQSLPNQDTSGAGVPGGKFLSRVKGILFDPKREWPLIAAEPVNNGKLYRNYVVPLAAIGPVAAFLGIPFFEGADVALQLAGIGFFIELGSAFVAALAFCKLAPKFGGRKDFGQALKLAAYSYTPIWLAHVSNFVPVLMIPSVALSVWYGVYLLGVGAPSLLTVPPNKMPRFFLLTLIVASQGMMLALTLGGVWYLLWTDKVFHQ